MATELNRDAFEHAKQLIADGRYVLDKQGDWDKAAPSSEQQKEYIHERGMKGYAEWNLGIRAGGSYGEKSNYSFPYGDFRDVYRSALIAAEEEATQYHHGAIVQAAQDLQALLPKDSE
ncbi:hypothetical protein [Actinomyces minihominis]|uniref:hypothetical protein n=1 Tax=Actinomyces minihominis TaxID=2002838 RepID=UPI000C08D6D1|nr:hypothetical protein [Actinomyces minihominis]